MDSERPDPRKLAEQFRVKADKWRIYSIDADAFESEIRQFASQCYLHAAALAQHKTSSDPYKTECAKTCPACKLESLARSLERGEGE